MNSCQMVSTIDEIVLENIGNSVNNFPKLSETDIEVDKYKNGLIFIGSELSSKLETIRDFQVKYPDFFGSLDFSYTENTNLNSIVDLFLERLYGNLEIGTEYQCILDDKTNYFFKEGLLRINNSMPKLSHIDFLELHSKLGKTINVFYLITDKIFSDISKGLIEGTISINAEINDILNNNFLRIIDFLSNKYGIIIDNNSIIIELLENQDVPNTEEFKNKIIELKKLGYKIALDDIEINTKSLNICPLSGKIIDNESMDLCIFLLKNIDMVKLDGKYIHKIYKIYKDDFIEFEKILTILKAKIKLMEEKGIKIIAEWVENIEQYNFIKNILGIKNYQGFYSKKPETINQIKANLNN